MKRLGLLLGVAAGLLILLGFIERRPVVDSQDPMAHPGASEEAGEGEGAPSHRGRRTGWPPFTVGRRLASPVAATLDDLDEFGEELLRLLEDDDLEVEELDLFLEPGEVRQIEHEQFAVAPEVLEGWAKSGFGPPGARLGGLTATGFGPGYLIENVNPGSAAAAMGLSSGDVLLGVNGRRFTEDDAASQFARALPRMEDVDLSVVRGGRLEAINYLVR